MNRLLLSAAHKSSGKTTLSIGLCAAYARRGQIVQSFKKGPDYIDPMWLSLASGRACHNLDFFLMPNQEILDTTMERTRGATLCLIEGNKGLYDGLDLDGSNSNAALAKLLRAPVILVIDARGMTRGVAPLLLGYQAFDRDVNIAGVILNQLGGRRHEKKLRAVIEHYTTIPVLGAVQQDERLAIVERHLGLMPSNEAPLATKKINAIADAVEQQVDLDTLLALAATAPPLPAVEKNQGGQASPASGRGDSDEPQKEPSPRPLPLRGRGDLDNIEGTLSQASPASGRGDSDSISIKIGIAQDAAFGFYYPGDLESLETHGATLVRFNTLEDKQLPDVDALLIGGGFPETHMQALEANVELRHAIRKAIDSGMPAYAECGGLMYLSRSLSWNGKRHEMVGVIPGDIVMHERPQGRGYVILRETSTSLWPGSRNASGHELRAHEFHYSSLQNLPQNMRYAYEVARGTGVDGKHDGIVINNLLATYTHMRDVGDNHWTRRFVAFIRGALSASRARP